MFKSKPMVFVRDAPEKKTRDPEAPTLSKLLITLNTNTGVSHRYFQAHIDELRGGLERMSELLFTHDEYIAQIIERGVLTGPGPRFNYTPTPDRRLDEPGFWINASSHTAVELGNKQSRLHVHVYWKILHRGGIRLKPGKIKELANEILLGDRYPYLINYVHITAHKRSPEDYVNPGADQTEFKELEETAAWPEELDRVFLAVRGVRPPEPGGDVRVSKAPT